MTAPLQSFQTFLAEQQMRQVTDRFTGTLIDFQTGGWILQGASGIGAVSLIAHGFGVDEQTALGLMRLAEQQECYIRPTARRQAG